MLPKTDEQATDSAAALRAVAWQQLPVKVRLDYNRQQPVLQKSMSKNSNTVVVPVQVKIDY